MARLIFVLCLTFLCYLDINASPAEEIPILGGLVELSEQEKNGLHPKLSHSFSEFGKANNEFEYGFKSIIGGKKQTVAGTRYEVKIEAEKKNNKVEICNADIWEKLWENNFFRVKLACPEKEYTIETNLPKTLV